jgi:hypothetical protein
MHRPYQFPGGPLRGARPDPRERGQLIGELTSATYFFSSGRFQIEPKDQIKKRLGNSPDLADALALTFSLPDAPAGMNLPRMNRPKVRKEYDPYAHV